MNKLKSLLIGAVTLVTPVAIPAAAFAGYAPSNRPTYQCVTPTNCPGADHVVFNSFTNAPNYGDERAFFDGKDATITGPGGYQDKLTNLKNGQKLVLRVYVHNNANPKAIGEAAATAHNTKLLVLLPTSQKSSTSAAAAISASNANPASVSDTVDFTADKPFTLSFDQSSPVQVTYRPNGQGDYVTRTLPGAAFKDAQTLEANLNDFKGCFEYSSLITMTVVVKMPTTPTPPETPPTTPPSTPGAPTTLVNTGPGEVAALFAVAMIGGTLGYRYVAGRLSRQ